MMDTTRSQWNLNNFNHNPICSYIGLRPYTLVLRGINSGWNESDIKNAAAYTCHQCFQLAPKLPGKCRDTIKKAYKNSAILRLVNRNKMMITGLLQSQATIGRLLSEKIFLRLKLRMHAEVAISDCSIEPTQQTSG